MQKTKIQFDKNVKTTNLNFQIGKDFQKWLYLGVIWARKESSCNKFIFLPRNIEKLVQTFGTNFIRTLKNNQRFNVKGYRSSKESQLKHCKKALWHI